ncbi:MAG TPA: ParA family protein [Planctomycetota bacterium]|nr:ParA family protein [Planctomycetota bacterium]
MRVLSLVNQKGGCGKTTTAIHLAAALSLAQQRVLVVDLDPQAHATMGLSAHAESGPSIADVLCDRVTTREALRSAPCGLSLLAACQRLAEFEEESARMVSPEHRLRNALAEVADQFDFALIDCPARADGVLTANALCASTSALLVIETGAFALQGAVRARALFEVVAEQQGSSFDRRVVGTLFDKRTRFAREMLVALHARFGEEMYDTVVRSSVRLREAAACGRPVFDIAPHCGGADDFHALAAEVLADRPEIGRPLQGPARAQAPGLTGATLAPGALKKARPIVSPIPG